MSIRERLARTPPGYRYSIGRILAIYSGLMVTLLLAALDQTILATALPRIVGDLGGLTQYSWVFTAYLLATTVTVPIYGKLGDVYGRRPLFLIAICIFLVGSALCGLAQSMTQLVVFRAVQGVRRRRLDPARARSDREHRPAARPRPLPGTDRRRVRRGIDHRPGDRRLHRRQHDVALDLLRQPARRRARAGRHLDHDAAPARRRAALDRLGRRRRARAGDDLAAARARVGRTAVRVELAARRRRARGCSRPAPRVRPLGAARRGADPALRHPAEPDRAVERPVHGAHRHGDVRDDRVRAAVRAGRDRHVGDVVRRRADAADARRGDDVVLRGPVGLADGPLPRETSSSGRSSSRSG